MTKYLNISQILVYYDFPEVFIAIDSVETNYLCLLVSVENENTNYIATAISSKRLSSFINGDTDLRDIFEEPEIQQWFTFNQVIDIIEAIEWKELVLPQEFLPEKGFSYHKQLHGDELILKESIEKRNAVIHLAVSDSDDNYSIDADNLSDIVKLYQGIIENSYKKTLAQKNIKEKKQYYIPQNYKLRAFASSYSSFNLHLYSTSKTDLFGNAIIEIGLEKFDEITRDFDNEEDFISVLRTVKGHTISGLKNLVKKLIDKDIKFKHKWYAPNQEKVSFTIIDKVKAEKIYAVLNLAEELTEEIKTFFGYFVQVDVEKGTWRIYNIEDEKEYSGEVSEQTLQGVTVMTVNYKITCQELIEELRVTEKEKTRYILQTIEKAN
jgi:hypothetical protein